MMLHKCRHETINLIEKDSLLLLQVSQSTNNYNKSEYKYLIKYKIYKQDKITHLVMLNGVTISG